MDTTVISVVQLIRIVLAQSGGKIKVFFPYPSCIHAVRY